ncbi:MAG TPA: polyprenyl synthetase family protein [Patescibacteria group bacterium]|nr:polyprenyl synthetase family protein [Patescibacteria group bacterium]
MIEEITAPIETELRDVEDEIRTLVTSDIPIINDIVGHVALHRGKRLRPMLVLLSSGMTGGITDISIKTSAMVELLHSATLIHDDVIDVSDLRRGAPSVNVVWGNKASILVGDLFFSRVLYRLAHIENPEVTNIMSMAIKWICEGELIQLQNGHAGGPPGERSYFDLITKKTAALLAVACELGVLSSSSNNGGRDRAAFRSFGRDLGIAFQIKDDVMDIVGTSDCMGKPASQDLLEHTWTLPLLYGLEHSNNGNGDDVRAILERGIESEDLETIRRFVRESGGIEYAERKAREYTDRALACLGDYEDTVYKRALVKLAGFVVDRVF